MASLIYIRQCLSACLVQAEKVIGSVLKCGLGDLKKKGLCGVVGEGGGEGEGEGVVVPPQVVACAHRFSLNRQRERDQ